MPRRIPIIAEGEYYHVYNRGALRLPLFLNDSLYDLLLYLVTIYSKCHKITVIAICLMPNHFHLILRIEEHGQLPKFMKSVCGTYSRRVNTLHGRTGTIYEGRYHAKHVPDDSYFKQLCRYIHLNPVRAKLVEHPADWRYSNYAESVGSRFHIHAAHGLVTDAFGGRRQYAEFVLTDKGHGTIENVLLLNDLAEMKLK
ncbi:MAG: transposase [Ignavibacteria bacterium]|nr:transposase [Ignavibacteria bacterium]